MLRKKSQINYTTSLFVFKEDGKTNQAIKSIKSDWTDAKSGQMKMIENRIVLYFFSEENVRQAGFIIAKYHVPINENFGKQIWGMKRTYVQLWKGLQVRCIVHNILWESSHVITENCHLVMINTMQLILFYKMSIIFVLLQMTNITFLIKSFLKVLKNPVVSPITEVQF